jgi:hypothetical protein
VSPIPTSTATRLRLAPDIQPVAYCYRAPRIDCIHTRPPIMRASSRGHRASSLKSSASHQPWDAKWTPQRTLIVCALFAPGRRVRWHSVIAALPRFTTTRVRTASATVRAKVRGNLCVQSRTFSGGDIPRAGLRSVLLLLCGCSGLNSFGVGRGRKKRHSFINAWQGLKDAWYDGTRGRLASNTTTK